MLEAIIGDRVLGEIIEVTFQQVQKYENESNRRHALKLDRIGIHSRAIPCRFKLPKLDILLAIGC